MRRFTGRLPKTLNISGYKQPPAVPYPAAIAKWQSLCRLTASVREPQISSVALGMGHQ